MLAPQWEKNDTRAKRLIYSVSIIVFIAIGALGRYQLKGDWGFDVHVFALFNAIINSCVAVLLVSALIAVKRKHFLLHKRLMLTAIVLSILFLVSYTAHHLLAGDTRFGGEGTIRYIYYFILLTHIPLAAIVLPFILFTAYRGLTGDYEKHKQIAKITGPLWLYVAITGPVLYYLIQPYY